MKSAMSAVCFVKPGKKSHKNNTMASTENRQVYQLESKTEAALEAVRGRLTRNIRLRRFTATGGSGFTYLPVIMDCHSRFVVEMEVSNSLKSSVFAETLKRMNTLKKVHFPARQWRSL